MNTLSNIDIINIINKYDLNYCFGGVYSKDKLPLLKPNTFYIINLENHNKGPGTHWTAFIIIQLNQYILILLDLLPL
jgi:hypothetical protein